MELGLCLLSCLTWIDLLKHFSTPKIGLFFFLFFFCLIWLKVNMLNSKQSRLSSASLQKLPRRLSQVFVR